MMAAKLEWVRDANGWWHAPRSCGAKGGYWSIAVKDNGEFVIAGEPQKYPNLPDAKAYCQAQEDAAAPPAELPKPGDVWGVPGKPETRRMFGGLDHDGEFVKWYGPHKRGVESVEQWQSWVTSSGAVRIDGEGTHDSQWREELAKFTDLLNYANSELNAERARVRELEALATERLNKLEDAKLQCQDTAAKLETVVDGVKHAISILFGRPEDDAESAGLRCHLMGTITTEAGYAYMTELDKESERADALAARVRELEGEVARLRAEQCPHDYGLLKRTVDGLEADNEDLRDRWEKVVKERDKLRMTQADGTIITAANQTDWGHDERLSELITRLAKERDDAQASRGRLMDALRGIRDAGNWATNGNQDAGKMRELARETIAREEMVKS